MRPTRNGIERSLMCGALALCMLAGCKEYGEHAPEVFGHAPVAQSESSRAELLLAGVRARYGSHDRIPERIGLALSEYRNVASGGDPRRLPEARAQLAATLQESGDTCEVEIETADGGAEVRYRSELDPASKVKTANAPTSPARITVPIGNYYIWAERNGSPTTDTSAVRVLTQAHESVKLVERIEGSGR